MVAPPLSASFITIVLSSASVLIASFSALVVLYFTFVVGWLVYREIFNRLYVFF